MKQHTLLIQIALYTLHTSWISAISSHILTVKNGTRGAIDIIFTLEGPRDCHAKTYRIESGDRKEINIDTCCATSYKIIGKTGDIAGLLKNGVLTSTGVDKKAYGMQSCGDQTFTVIQTGGNNNLSPLILDTVNGIQ